MSTTDASVRVGVLSLHNSKETKAILNAVEDLGHTPVWLREENIVCYADGTSITPRPDIDIVVNRLLLTKGVRPIEDLALAATYDAVRPVLNPPCAVLTAMHKYAALWTLASAGVPVPESLFALNHAALNSESEHFRDPLVQKVAISTHGAGVWKASPTDPLAPTVVQRRTFLQEFLESDAERPYDLRVYVVDGTVVGAMERYAPAGDWRSNVAHGGEVENVTGTLAPEAKRLATTATAALGLDYAGVDLIETNDQWYVLEVNATAGFKALFDATNRSVAPYIARLAIERAGEVVEETRITDLVTELDDSVPDSKPSSPEQVTDPTPIGYTEEVTVGGNTDMTTAIAKSDTGAQRTSIGLELAGEIGAGPITGKTNVKSGSGTSSRPVVDVAIRIQDDWQVVTASVEDRENMTYPLILGRDILEPYRIDLQQRADEE